MSTLANFLTEYVRGAPIVNSNFLELDQPIEGLDVLKGELAVRELAFYQCCNLIANTVASCEFKTFKDGLEYKGKEYYRWNFQPNQNENFATFMDKLITRLYRDNEVLVVVDNSTNGLYVADSWDVDDTLVVKEKIYKDVTIGNFCWKRSFPESSVIRMQLNDKNMRPILNEMYSTYEELLRYSMNAYKKSRGTKGALKIPAGSSNNPTVSAYVNNLSKSFKTFSEAESAIMPLFEGMEYTDLARKVYNDESSRDIRAQFDDIVSFTARAFQIPPAVMLGNVEGLNDVIDQFLTFCIDPLCKMLEKEINRKIYKKRVLKGGFIRIDTTAMKHIDLLSVAVSIDKLISSGAYTINEVRALIGSEPTPQDFGDIHWMTKNYATAVDVANSGVGAGDATGNVVTDEEYVETHDTDGDQKTEGKEEEKK